MTDELLAKKACIEAEIADMESRAKTLARLIEGLRRRLKGSEYELRQLRGNGWYQHGKIRQSKANLTDIGRKLSDVDKPTVVFPDLPSGQGYIVGRVSPNRIYIREIGHTSSTLYYLDGTAVGDGHCMDIAETFPMFDGKVPTPKQWKEKYG